MVQLEEIEAVRHFAVYLDPVDPHLVEQLAEELGRRVHHHSPGFSLARDQSHELARPFDRDVPGGIGHVDDETRRAAGGHLGERVVPG